jgi:SAM-dependent methyltransferase
VTTTTQRLTADEWDTWHASGWPTVVTGKEAENFHRAVQPHPGMNAVDLACGSGQWTRQLAAWGVRVTGYDFSATALRQADAAGLRDGLSYARWDIDADPIPPALKPGSLDLVTCRHALPFLEYARALTDVGRWLKPSGVFYALVRVANDENDDKTTVDSKAKARNDSSLKRFHRGLTEARIAGLSIGWARCTTYRLSARNCAIVLRSYGDTAFASPDAGGETRLPATAAALCSPEVPR